MRAKEHPSASIVYTRGGIDIKALITGDAVLTLRRAVWGISREPSAGGIIWLR